MSELFYRAAGAVLAPFRYAEREVQHMKEVAKEDMQMYIAKAIKFSIMGIAALLFLLFLSIMIAAWINQAMDSNVAGFAIVAGFYLLVGVAVYVMNQAADKKKDAANTRRPVGA